MGNAEKGSPFSCGEEKGRRKSNQVCSHEKGRCTTAEGFFPYYKKEGKTVQGPVTCDVREGRWVNISFLIFKAQGSLPGTTTPFASTQGISEAISYTSSTQISKHRMRKRKGAQAPVRAKGTVCHGLLRGGLVLLSWCRIRQGRDITTTGLQKKKESTTRENPKKGRSLRARDEDDLRVSKKKRGSQETRDWRTGYEPGGGGP